MHARRHGIRGGALPPAGECRRGVGGHAAHLLWAPHRPAPSPPHGSHAAPVPQPRLLPPAMCSYLQPGCVWGARGRAVSPAPSRATSPNNPCALGFLGRCSLLRPPNRPACAPHPPSHQVCLTSGLGDARKELRIKSFLREWGEDGPVVHALTLAQVGGVGWLPSLFPVAPQSARGCSVAGLRWHEGFGQGQSAPPAPPTPPSALVPLPLLLRPRGHVQCGRLSSGPRARGEGWEVQHAPRVEGCFFSACAGTPNPLLLLRRRATCVARRLRTSWRTSRTRGT